MPPKKIPCWYSTFNNPGTYFPRRCALLWMLDSGRGAETSTGAHWSGHTSGLMAEGPAGPEWASPLVLLLDSLNLCWNPVVRLGAHFYFWVSIFSSAKVVKDILPASQSGCVDKCDDVTQGLMQCLEHRKCEKSKANFKAYNKNHSLLTVHQTLFWVFHLHISSSNLYNNIWRKCYQQGNPSTLTLGFHPACPCVCLNHSGCHWEDRSH